MSISTRSLAALALLCSACSSSSSDVAPTDAADDTAIPDGDGTPLDSTIDETAIDAAIGETAADAAIDATENDAALDARLDVGSDAPNDAPADAPIVDVQPSFPIRATFYYPWFPESWKQQGLDPFTRYHPTLGFYDSSSSATLASHLAMMKYAKIDAGIASWWGIGTKTDGRMPLLLAAAAGSTFRWSVYYEPEGVGDPTAATIAADLAHLAKQYGKDPSFLRVGGKFVVFVYADPNDGCAMADRWKAANPGAVGAYVVLKVFPGYAACASQPDSWHQYAPANATDGQGSFSFTISPGFFKANESTARLARDPARWKANVQAMVASKARFQLVTTFDEWGEGTAVEPATEWASSSGMGVYLDALHTDGL